MTTSQGVVQTWDAVSNETHAAAPGGVQDKAQNIKGTLTNYAQSIKDETSEQARRAQEAARGYAQGVQQKATEYSSKAQKGMEQFRDQAGKALKEAQEPAMLTALDALLVLGNGVLELFWPFALMMILLLNYPLVAFFRAVAWLFNFPINMRNKVVLITGASSGIGEHIAYEYAKLGAHLALVARRDEPLQAVAEKCRLLGARVLPIQADLSHDSGCQQAVEETVQEYNTLNTLVLNAGLGQVFSFDELDDMKKVRQIMDVNFWGYVNTTRFALPHLKRTGGQIVVNDSVGSYLPHVKSTIYNASKAAVSQFFETLRLELGPSVPITIFLPGVIKSELTDGKVITPSGQFTSGDEVIERRSEAGWGLFPVYPTSALAYRAVRAARYRLQRAVIPSWYKIMFFIQIFLPELLQAQLYFGHSGRDSAVKQIGMTLGGGLKAPTDTTFADGYKKEE